jgi:putative phage-type endonuclease
MTDSEWHEWRGRGIGSSDIAAILGISPWASPYSIWQDKALGINDRGGNMETMQWGKLLESAILAETERRLGFTIYGEQTRYEHPDYPFARCTVDALFADDTADDGIVECKTTSDVKWSAIPTHYEAQVQWQLAVCNRQRAWIACLHNGRKLSLWPIERDQDTGDAMLAIAAEFWDGVLTGQPPDLDGSLSTTNALASRYAAPVEGETVELDSLADVIDSLRNAKTRKTEAESLVSFYENEIKAVMGDATIGTVDGMEAVTWKTRKSRRLDRELLNEKYPNEVAECMYDDESRYFIVKRDRYAKH